MGEKLPYTKNQLKNDTQMPQHTSSDIKSALFHGGLVSELQINNDFSLIHIVIRKIVGENIQSSPYSPLSQYFYQK